MAIRYHTIIEESFVDGPGGPRVVLVMQGCSIQCPGCQNEALWDAQGEANEMSPIELAALLLSKSDRITITGGEPTDQYKELWRLMVIIRQMSKTAHVIIYTGRKIESLIDGLETGSNLARSNFGMAALILADTVVDGPFDASQDDDHLQWRGSRNQRPIDMRASIQATRARGLAAKHVRRFLVLEDWDTPTLILTDDGVIGAKGLIEELDLTQEAIDATRRCGEVR